MIASSVTKLREELERLRTELIELAYAFDLRGRLDAADMAMTTAARLHELCQQFDADSARIGRRTVFAVDARL